MIISLISKTIRMPMMLIIIINIYGTLTEARTFPHIILFNPHQSPGWAVLIVTGF